MARTPKLSVYERIENIQEEIKKTEMRLTGLKNQLKEYEVERDELEMKQLFSKMKEQGLSIEQAIESLTTNKNND